MDPSEKQSSKQKKSRNPFPTSTRSTSALAAAAPRTGGVALGGSGATPPSSGGGTSSQQSPNAYWAGISLGSSFTTDTNPSSSECRM
ncbi:unnamed protein product [Urochloa humidicola]